MITTFARDVLGQELWPEQVSILDTWEETGKRKGVLCLGRRSGKSLMADCTAIENAVVPDLSAYLRVGETRFILIFATNAQQAQRLAESLRLLSRDRRALGLESIWWYDWAEPDAGTSVFDYSGLWRRRPDGRMVSKPAFGALRRTVRALRGR